MADLLQAGDLMPDDGALEIEDDAIIEIEPDPPLSERLKVGTELHSKLVTQLREMRFNSKSHMEQKDEDWTRVDEHLRLYVNLDREARAGDKGVVGGRSKGLKENPFARSICIPLTYSTIMTRMVHLFSIFTQVDPFIHLQPAGGEDKMWARVHEACLHRDAMLSNYQLAVWQMLYDAERYGVTCWYDTWAEKYGWAYKSPGESLDENDIMAGSNKEWTLLQEWNHYRPIDPRCLLPDPTRPIIDVQRMNYMGHWEIVNWLEMHTAQLKNGEGPYFNVKEARKRAQSKKNADREAGRWMDGQYSEEHPTDEYPNLELTHFQWKIIPSEWDLSPSDKVEIWWFSLAEEEVIVRCHPSQYDHNEFSYSIGAPDPDLHSPFTPSMAMHLIGGQDLTNWLVNSHIANIRKIVNDQVLYNQDLIEEEDILSPGPARHIRLTREGRMLHKRGILSIDQMYGQFRITDVTGVHLDAAQAILNQLQRMSATPDTVQGMPLPTKRTLGEIEHSSSAATMRIGVTAQLLDLQVVKPTAERNVINRQQFTSLEQIYRISEQLAQELGTEQLMVRPTDLYGRYDYVARTPTMAKDPARSAALWGSLLQILASAPQLMEPRADGRVINPHSVFNEFLKISGINYFDNFYEMAPVQVMPDEQIQQGVQSGNMVPAPEGMGGMPSAA
jgi:hypothetical protein